MLSRKHGEARRALLLAGGVCLGFLGWTAYGYFSHNLPAGTDIFAEPPWGFYLYKTWKQYHSLSMWSDHWYGGFPTMTVFSPLYAVIIALLKGAGVDVVVTLKGLMFASFAGSFVAMFLLLRSYALETSACYVGALVYMLVPYHLGEVYLEGHALMDLSYALAPACFYMLDRSVQEPMTIPRLWRYSFIFALFMLSHIQAVLFLVGPFLIIYLAIEARSSRKAWGRGLSFMFGGALLTGVWLVPLFVDHSLYTSSLAQSFSGAFSAVGSEILSLRVITGRYHDALFPLWRWSGAFWILVSCFAYSLTVRLDALERRYLRLAVVWIGFALGSAWLAYGRHVFPSLFSILYNMLPIFHSIRTPNRFMVPYVLAVSIILALSLQSVRWPERRKAWLALALTILCWTSVSPELNSAFLSWDPTGSYLGMWEFLASRDGSEDRRILGLPATTWVRASTEVLERSKQRTIMNPARWTNKTRLASVGGLSPGKALATNRLWSYIQHADTGTLVDEMDVLTRFWNVGQLVVKTDEMTPNQLRRLRCVLKNRMESEHRYGSEYLVITLKPSPLIYTG